MGEVSFNFGKGLKGEMNNIYFRHVLLVLQLRLLPRDHKILSKIIYISLLIIYILRGNNKSDLINLAIFKVITFNN